MSVGPVLLVHNYYRQRGGEDRLFEAEAQLLADAGLDVHTWTVHNDEVESSGLLAAGLGTVWNPGRARELARLVRHRGIRVVHFHNTFPRVSPAAYGAVRRAGAATVQTLHNFRLLCAKAVLFRAGTVCEDCLGLAVPWPALRHRCYRDSLPATGAVVAMQVAHRVLGTWAREVDAYLALTPGARERFGRYLPLDRIRVLGNFLPDGPDPEPPAPDGFALFIGRLDEAKGVATLLQAWAERPAGLPDLVLAGDGPLAPAVRAAADRDPRITWAGFCDPARIRALLGRAALVVIPSGWYEGFPLVLLEAWAAGRPVLASRIGALAELVRPGQDGWLAPPGDPAAWAGALAGLGTAPGQLGAAGAAARARFLSDYTAQAHGRGLLAAYQAALATYAASRP